MEFEMKKLIVASMLALGLLVTGCKESDDTATVTPAAPTEALPATLIATTQPSGDAQDVAALKKSAKDGDRVVVRGRVGGTPKPLADNRAIMTVADLGLPTCEKTAMATCPTPWDSCCEPKEALTASTATVQVVGADGKPLKATLDGAGGIKPLKQVVVAGVVKNPPGGEAMVIEASQIYVAP
jgi:hypothetical protein